MQGLLEGIRNFNSDNLRNIFTTETTQPVVQDKAEPKGNYRWHFGHEDEADKIEWFDDPAEFRKKCKEIAQVIKESKYVVVYTGAGISTSAKLPDYRGSDGMWTNRDQGTSYDKSKYVSTISAALPTIAHMAIAELVRRDIVKAVVSTNVDGLHMRSGIPSDCLMELHGNSYLESCEKCHTKYLRTQDILQNQTEEHRLVNRHWCGGICEKENCGGKLLDNIVAFGENLPEDHLSRAISNSKKGDFALVLGTTMMVQPACLLPENIYKKKNGKMIICNLQRTPYDSHAFSTVRGHTDDVLVLVMKELGIPIPTETAEFKIPAYVDEIDVKHLKKIEENKKKLKEIEEEKRENAGKTNALQQGKNIYNREVITGTNKKESVTFNGLQLAFFNHCKDSEFSVDSNTKKIVIEDCHNVVIVLNAKIITHTLEIINSTNLVIRVNTPIFTVTCDNSTNISLNFLSADNFEMVAWANAKDCTLTVGGGEIKIVPSSGVEVDVRKDQIVTRKNLKTGEIVSSVTRRDYAGRIVELV